MSSNILIAFSTLDLSIFFCLWSAMTMEEMLIRTVKERDFIAIGEHYSANWTGKSFVVFKILEVGFTIKLFSLIIGLLIIIIPIHRIQFSSQH